MTHWLVLYPFDDGTCIAGSDLGTMGIAEKKDITQELSGPLMRIVVPDNTYHWVVPGLPLSKTDYIDIEFSRYHLPPYIVRARYNDELKVWFCWESYLYDGL